MRLNELSDNPGATKPRTRVGRGVGSGKGKTAGRGVKGQKSRSGVAIKGFEGGQMPIHMRLPKRGFNKPNRKKWTELSIANLERAIQRGKLDLKKPVDAEALVKAGVIRRANDGVRLIGGGELSKAVNLVVSGATPGATKIVEKAKGSVEVTEAKPVRAKKDADAAPKAKKAAPVKKAAEPKKAPAPKAEPKPVPAAKAAPAAPKAAAPKVLYTDGPTDGEPDDLKKIKGIGPKFEGDLNSKGIYYYRQIAAWKPADVEMVEGIIDSFPGRIERDEWIKQAAGLADGAAPRAMKAKPDAAKAKSKSKSAGDYDKHIPYFDNIKEKYDAKADEAVVMTLTKYLGASLNDRDAKYVACGDETERNTVRDAFLKKKLGLKDDNEVLDAKVMAVCDEMKAAKQRMKDRVTFYYLLAKNEGKLGDL